MSNEAGNHREAGEFEPDERELDRLLRTAGPRPEVPPEDLASIKAAFRQEWVTQVARPLARRRRRAASYLALAAGLLVVLGLAWFARAPVPMPPRGEILARILAVDAGSTVGAGVWSEGDAVRAGSVLSTADDSGRLALRLNDGHEVRLDRGSRVVMVSAAVLELARGAVYVDSGGEAGSPGLEVQTPFGPVRELGTQFEVRLLEGDGGMRVRVREGEVRVARESAAVGTELTLEPNGAVQRSVIPSHGEAWSWVLDSAPALEIEGRSLGDVLARVKRETGWTVRFESPELAAKAAGIVVHGSLEGVRPDRVHEIVLPGAGLAYELENGSLLIKTPN